MDYSDGGDDDGGQLVIGTIQPAGSDHDDESDDDDGGQLVIGTIQLAGSDHDDDYDDASMMMVASQ